MSHAQGIIHPFSFRQIIGEKLTFLAAFVVQQTARTTAAEEQDKDQYYQRNSDAKRQTKYQRQV